MQGMYPDAIEINLQERKQILVGILESVDEYCRKNKLKYYLYFGTLLGAVRHKGFIPWDDDVDIAMPRKDYEKFVKEFNCERKDMLRVIAIENEGTCYTPFAKVVDYRTRLREDISDSVEIGINIDVFPLDYLSNDYGRALRLDKSIAIYRKILHYLSISYIPRQWYKKMVLSMLKLIKRESVVRRIVKKAKKYSAMTDSKYVASVVTMTTGIREIMETDFFTEEVELEFENKMYKAPVKYKKVLEHLYGDTYMQLPPVEERITHHCNKAWWRVDEDCSCKK